MNYVLASPRTAAALLCEEPYVAVECLRGDEAIAVILRKILEANAHYHEPVSRSAGATATETFHRLSREWKHALRYVSSMTEIVLHPAYQQIIGMGKDALPFILRDLADSPDHWFWALRSITGVDPVPVEKRGRLREMARAWLEWARGQGLKW